MMQNRERKVTCIPAQEVAANSRNCIPTGLKRVAAYCRVSTDEEEQQSSFENQIEYYTQLIANNPKWIQVGIFADEGISGTQTRKRSEFLKLMQLCEDGKVDIVLVKSISRFARNTVDTLNYVRKLKEKNIAIIFEKENINTLDISSEMILTLYSSFAQAESESISQNITWSKRKEFKQGKVTMSCTNLLGYDKGENGEWVINQEQSKIVRWIYLAYLSGLSLYKIKKMLEKNEIKTLQGKTLWQLGTINNILQNEKYIGDVLLQKTFTVDVLSHKVKKNDGELPQYYVTDHHEAIIPKEIWYLVKAEMARRHTVKHKNTVNQIKKGRYSSQYALTELLICGECGTAYRRVTWAKRGKKKVVWRCVNRLLNGKKYCKHSPSLEESVLQEAIIWAINQYIKDKEQLKRCIKESIKDARQFVPENNADGLDEKIRMMEQSIMDLSELLSLSSAELDYFDQKFAELENSLKSLYLKKQEAETVKKVGVNFDQLDEEIMVWIDHQEFDLTQYNDVLVRKLIREVKVLQQDKIEILFMDGEKLESLVRI